MILEVYPRTLLCTSDSKQIESSSLGLVAMKIAPFSVWPKPHKTKKTKFLTHAENTSDGNPVFVKTHFFKSHLFSQSTSHPVVMEKPGRRGSDVIWLLMEMLNQAQTPGGPAYKRSPARGQLPQFLPVTGRAGTAHASPTSLAPQTQTVSAGLGPQEDQLPRPPIRWITLHLGVRIIVLS